MFAPRQQVRIKATGDIGTVRSLYADDEYKVEITVGKVSMYVFAFEGDLEPLDNDGRK